MKVTAEKLPESRILLQIEVEPERLEQAMNQAYRRVVGRARIPGFRPGKAPRPMVERYLGRGALLQEALDKLVPEVYQEAIKQEGIEPIDRPELELPQTEPVIVKATIPVRPRIDLGNYQQIRVEPEEVGVDEQVIDDAIEQLRHRYATIEPAERPIQRADIIRADIHVTIDDQEPRVYNEIEFHVGEQLNSGLPGLLDHLVGMEPGADRQFVVDVPETAEDDDFAGKTIHYSVTIHEVKQEHLPDLDDEFALQVGEGFATMLALRERLLADARTKAETAATDRYGRKALDAVVAGTSIEYPSVLLDREIDQILSEQAPKQDQRQAMQRYLAQVGKTEQDLRADVRPAAAERLVRSLALMQFVEAEGIEAGPDEIEAEIARMAGDDPAQAERLRELFGTEQGKNIVLNSLLTRKAFDRLRAIASNPSPPEAGAAANETAATQVAAVSEASGDVDLNVQASAPEADAEVTPAEFGMTPHEVSEPASEAARVEST
ncbi:MAG: trigger factor [Dehalococcoidia bacterium]